MTKYILKRIVTMIPVLIGVAIIIFTLLYFTPGDPISIIMVGSTQQEINEVRTQYGLNEPYLVQLGSFLKQAFLQLDLGKSYIKGIDVFSELMVRLPCTALIATAVCALQLIVAVPIGISAATHQNKWQDSLCMILTMVGVSVPEFWFAMILMLIFSLRLGWLPSYGITSWKGYVLPIVAAAVPTFGGVARLTRSQMLEVIRSDYCVTARMKGVPERAIIYRHALPNALIPIVTNIGMTFGRALGGTVIIETVFALPGIGLYLVNAIGNRDYPVVRGAVLVLAILFSLVMLLVDILYAFIDPRIKAQYEVKKGGGKAA
ncbi:MAG: ABC transporter permease [Lachnospiraceae bacterium]